MTQKFEEIGGVSPILDNAISEHQGWDTQPSEPLGLEQVDASDFSQADVRGNRQILGATGGVASETRSPQPYNPHSHANFAGAQAAFPMAGHTEPPMAAQQVTPPGGYPEAQP